MTTDFTRFLNSKAISKYLQKLNYKFSPEEAAYVVHEARNIPLSEKHKAYEEIISEYPDAILCERKGDFKTQPLSEFLRRLMQLENDYVAECKAPSQNAVYTYLTYTEDYNGKLCWYLNGYEQGIYSTYEKCFCAASGEEAVKLRIKKRYLNGDESVEVELLPNGTVLSVVATGKEEGITDAFDWFWVKLPTPFRRGDILRSVREITPYMEERIVVLTFMSTWGGKELAENGFTDRGSKPLRERKKGELDFAAWNLLVECRKKGGDRGDMNLEGYEVLSNGEVRWDTHVTYLDFELCRDVPNDKKALLPLSAFIKGEISEDLLLNAYRCHVLNKEVEQARELFGIYTDESLALTGIEKPDKSKK